jgi:NADH dehydrogenase
MAKGTVLVTGAAGSIGASLLEALRAAGWRTRALEHRRPVTAADAIARGDLADPSSLTRAMAGVDAVLHLAALTHARRARRYFEVNAAGTAALVDAFRRSPAERLVLVSTRAVSLGGGAYSVSKKRAEEVVRALGSRQATVRLPEVYGAGGAEGVDRLIASAAAGRTLALPGRGEHEIRPVLVDDLIDPLVAALDAGPAAGRTYTLAGTAMTTRAFAESCVAAFGGRGRIARVPVPILAVACALARVAPLPVYPDQLARLRAAKPGPSTEAGPDLGFRSRGVEEGLTVVRERLGPRGGDVQATEREGEPQEAR